MNTEEDRKKSQQRIELINAQYRQEAWEGAL